MSVYKGDLTNERVDIIVNSSSNRLRDEGGLSRTILDRGGKIIQKESDKILAKRNSLRDGDAVITNSGYLPCKKVVHAVGPDCRVLGLSQSRILLRRACLNSLFIAQELKMTSIALPAVGSGTCGMPKDECAKVMFDAVEEFVKQGNPKKKTIIDIRFVNTDDHSVQVFRTEFISRYGNGQVHSDSEKLTGGSSISVLPNGSEGAVSSWLPSSTSGPGKNKSKQSSYNGRIATNPRAVVSSHHDHAIGNINASADHPLSVSDQSNTSYSGTVRENPGAGGDVVSSTAQDPGGRCKPGFYLKPSTGRKFVGKANNTKLKLYLTVINGDDCVCYSGWFSFSGKKSLKSYHDADVCTTAGYV